MIIGLPKAKQSGETRVALTPAVVKRLVAMDIQVLFEPGAGRAANHSDDDYRDAGAKEAQDSLYGSVDVITTVEPPSPDDVSQMKEGAMLIGLLAPLKNLEMIKAAAESKVTVLAMEFIPRISRAQAMDALSSQANIAGYKAVIMAAYRASKIYPMMMTAAGTIAPSRVFVIGAGVAGLQAIATAKRLGAVVEAFDVRPVVKEQVQSLGARFVELPVADDKAEAAGGYAGEQTKEQQQKQAELMAKHVTGADAVITTAAIFGKAPPLLIPKDVAEQMSAGSVLVDMAADPDEGRGNCEITRPGECFQTDNQAIIDGTLNLPALVPVHASQAYANNLLALLKELVDKEGNLQLDLEDEIQKGAVLVHDGQVVNEMIKGKM